MYQGYNSLLIILILESNLGKKRKAIQMLRELGICSWAYRVVVTVATSLNKAVKPVKVLSHGFRNGFSLSGKEACCG